MITTLVYDLFVILTVGLISGIVFKRFGLSSRYSTTGYPRRRPRAERCGIFRTGISGIEQW